MHTNERFVAARPRPIFFLSSMSSASHVQFMVYGLYLRMRERERERERVREREAKSYKKENFVGCEFLGFIFLFFHLLFVQFAPK